MWVRSNIDVCAALLEKLHFKRSESCNIRKKSGQFPLGSPADYHFKDLILN